MVHVKPPAIKHAKALIKECVPHVHTDALSAVNSHVAPHVMANVQVDAMIHAEQMQKRQRIL